MQLTPLKTYLVNDDLKLVGDFEGNALREAYPRSQLNTLAESNLLHDARVAHEQQETIRELFENVKALSFMVDYFLPRTAFSNHATEASWKKAQMNAHAIISKLEPTTTEEPA